MSSRRLQEAKKDVWQGLQQEDTEKGPLPWAWGEPLPTESHQWQEETEHSCQRQGSDKVPAGKEWLQDICILW